MVAGALTPTCELAVPIFLTVNTTPAAGKSPDNLKKASLITVNSLTSAIDEVTSLDVTKAVVFCEYAALALIHAGVADAKYRKSDRAGALFHSIAAIAAIVFPFFYLQHEMRLHHSFYGLALMALPSRPAKILGSMITLDSSLYMLAPIRGGFTTAGRFVSFDFINIIVNRFPLFFNGSQLPQSEKR